MLPRETHRLPFVESPVAWASLASASSPGVVSGRAERECLEEIVGVFLRFCRSLQDWRRRESAAPGGGAPFLWARPWKKLRSASNEVAQPTGSEEASDRNSALSASVSAGALGREPPALSLLAAAGRPSLPPLKSSFSQVGSVSEEAPPRRASQKSALAPLLKGRLRVSPGGFCVVDLAVTEGAVGAPASFPN